MFNLDATIPRTFQVELSLEVNAWLQGATRPTLDGIRKTLAEIRELAETVTLGEIEEALDEAPLHFIANGYRVLYSIDRRRRVVFVREIGRGSGASAMATVLRLMSKTHKHS